jgi:putative ABC transport system permease protein
MVKHASAKDFLREIKKTISRFISIILLLILSVSFFSGLRVTKPDMQMTADAYMDTHHMYDVKVLSTLGLTGGDIDAINKLGGGIKAVGFYEFDAIATALKQDIVISVLTINDTGVNSPELLSGRLPVQTNECAVEERFLTTMDLKIGDTFDIKEVAASFDSALEGRTFKIVGMVRSPAYITKLQRGSSTLGSGTISAYIMIPSQAVHLDYFTEADITIAGALQQTAYTDTYKDTVRTVTDQLEELEKTQAPIRYDEVSAKAGSDLLKAKSEFNEKKAEFEDSKKQLSDAKAEVADGWAKLNAEKAKAGKELKKAWDKLEKSNQDIISGTKDLNEAQKTLDSQKAAGEAQLSAALDGLNNKQSQLDSAYTAYNDARVQLEQQLKDWNALPDSQKLTMPEKGAALDAAQKQLDAQKQQLDTQQAALNAGLNDLNNQKTTLGKQLADAQQKIDTGLVSLKTGRQQLEAGRREYDRQKAEADKKFADAEAALKEAESEITDNEAKIIDGQAKLDQGAADIKDAETKIADIQANKWYVEDRSGNIGYNNFGQDADRMGALGNIFPMIFFAVAALVCLTTMTRMVDEKRTEIGTYKALGHSSLTTAGKFIYYSLFATAIGLTGGILAGSFFFPRFIFKAYSIMYNLPPIITPLNLGIILTAAAIALVCTVGATIFACFNTLREMPASLLRPKAPEPGKRVLLEYITPVWKRMSFFAKVSTRNIFRYKKRLIMTLLGIAGCTALIVTGFGLRDSIIDITEKQFGEIMKYDLQVALSDNASKEPISTVLNNNTGVSDFMYEQSVAADMSTHTGTLSGHVIIPEKQDEINGFIRMAHRIDEKTVTLTDDGAVITEKMAELLGLKVGDTFTLDADGKYTVKVSDIVENYVNHFVYMTPTYYKTVFGKDTEANQVLVKLADEQPGTADAVSADLLKLSDVSYVSNFSTIAKSFKDSMNSVNYVVLIILVSAALLALVVLYNLTNINITERNRELATIKVLGFYDREVSWYIFRENTILTVAGVLIGLLGGKFLHSWLVRTVELDFVMFGRQAKPMSYVFAALLTFLFAVLVNIIGHGHMKRINMVESLKTNE